ncbi:MAG: hypothetical protein KGY99_04185 [Phycisphaerae bacterium]|nr:hypothetical protein [Phycisphaerae bacterium]
MPLRPAVCLAALSAALVAAPALGEDNPTHALDYAYPTGEHLLRYDIVQSNSTGAAGSGDMTITTRMDIPLTIAAGGGSDARDVTMTVRRITATLVADDMERIVDSDRPDTLMPGLPLDVLCEATFEAKIAANGEIAEFTGVEAFVEKAEMGGDDPDARAEAVTGVSSGLQQLLAEPMVYLPAGRVAAGDTWTVERKVYGLPIMGAQKVHAETLTCTLESVTRTDTGRIARVTIDGATKLLSGATATDPATLTKTGHVAYNLDTGDLAAHHIELAGKKTVAMGDEKVTVTAKTVIDAQVDPPAEDDDDADDAS